MTDPLSSALSECQHLSTVQELAAAFADGALTRGELMARAVALLTTENVDEILAAFDGHGRQQFVGFAWQYATDPGATSFLGTGLTAPPHPEETLRALRIIAGVDERGELAIGVLVGARLRELRIEAEMTTVEVAEAAGLHREVYSRLERGLHVPDIELVSKAARALEVGLVDVLAVLDPEWRETMGWSPRAAYHPVLLDAARKLRASPSRRWRMAKARR